MTPKVQYGNPVHFIPKNTQKGQTKKIAIYPLMLNPTTEETP